MRAQDTGTTARLGAHTPVATTQGLAYAHAETFALSINLASMIAAALLAWRLPPAPATSR